MQPEELINLIVSLGLFAYLMLLIRGRRMLLPGTWFGGMILMLCSQFFTIAESFVLSDLFNSLEHLSFSAASFLFLAGSFHYGRDSRP